jgi:hypothetical protein
VEVTDVLPRVLVFVAVASSLLAQTPASSVIRFEDATAASGIQFTHSFGAQQLGSLLESTGGGCVWFDYNRIRSSRLLRSCRTITFIAMTGTANSPT